MGNDRSTPGQGSGPGPDLVALIPLARTDWKTREGRAQYARDKRATSRDQDLDAIVPTRRCPCCRKIRSKSRSWVVLAATEALRAFSAAECSPARGLVAVCRSCWWRRKAQ